MVAPSHSSVGASPLWEDVQALAALTVFASPTSSNRTRARGSLPVIRRGASVRQ